MNNAQSVKVRYYARGIATDYSAPTAPECSIGTATALVRYLKARGYTAWCVDAHTGAFVPVRGAKRNPER